MNELKCPFCQQELKELYNNGISVGFRCKNKNCPETNIMCGTKTLWQALIDTKKKLDIAVDALKSAKIRMKLINNSKLANLNCVLQIQTQCEILKIDKALEQINQKDGE